MNEFLLSRRVPVFVTVAVTVLVAIVAMLGGKRFLFGRAPSSSAAASQTGTLQTGTPVLLVEPIEIRAVVAEKTETLSGQVEPLHVATISSEVNALVLNRPIERGDRITKGMTLVALDAAQVRAARDQAAANLTQTTATRRQLESEYAKAVTETQSARDEAGAKVRSAQATEQKTRTSTRAQELRQAEAALAQAQTDERLAKIEYERYSRLVRDGAVAQQSLDRASATLDADTARRKSAEEGVSLAREGARREDIEIASAQVQIARATQRTAGTRSQSLAALRSHIDSLCAQEAAADASLRQAQILLDKHRIVAPLTGRVLQTLIEVGETVAPGTPLARIADIHRVKVTFAVPEASRAALHLDRRVSVTADVLSGKSFAGRITQLGVEANKQDRSFAVEITVDNPNTILLPNMVARWKLAVEPPHRILQVPVESVATDGGSNYLFVLAEGKARRRDVTLGFPTGGNIEIVRGLQVGETIARTPQRLTDGAHIRTAADLPTTVSKRGAL